MNLDQSEESHGKLCQDSSFCIVFFVKLLHMEKKVPVISEHLVKRQGNFLRGKKWETWGICFVPHKK